MNFFNQIEVEAKINNLWDSHSEYSAPNIKLGKYRDKYYAIIDDSEELIKIMGIDYQTWLVPRNKIILKRINSKNIESPENENVPQIYCFKTLKLSNTEIIDSIDKFVAEEIIPIFNNLT